MNKNQIFMILMFSLLNAAAAEGGTWPIGGVWCPVFWFVVSACFFVLLAWIGDCIIALTVRSKQREL